jgi:hypothetical protein
MNTNHSSLLADTGLSEIELDRMGAVPTRRKDDPRASVGDKGLDRILGHPIDNGTLAEFEGMEWFDDPDVARNIPRRKEWWGAQ